MDGTVQPPAGVGGGLVAPVRSGPVTRTARRKRGPIMCRFLGRGLVGLCVVIALWAGVGTAQKPSVDWPLFRGNTVQNGVAAAQLPDKLEVLWKFDAKDSIEGAPAVVGVTAYVASMDEHLYALDLATGKEKWRYKAAP